MAKKRTRKDKKNAQHPFLVDWDENDNESISGVAVKGKKGKEKNSRIKKTKKANNANVLDKSKNAGTIRRDIFRSVLIALFILGMEVVLYFTWQV